MRGLRSQVHVAAGQGREVRLASGRGGTYVSAGAGQGRELAGDRRHTRPDWVGTYTEDNGDANDGRRWVVVVLAPTQV